MNNIWYLVAAINATMVAINGYFYVQGIGAEHALVTLFCAIATLISFREARHSL